MLLVWIDALLEWSKFVGFHWYIRIKTLLVKVLTVVSVSLVLLWLAVFLYGVFYYTYMPSVSHVRDVNLQFRADCDAAVGTLCSFPTANLSLLAENQREILMKGQPYVILVELNMPESPVNQHIGMFMVEMKVHSHNGKVVQTGSRAGLLEYKSSLYQLVETLVYLPSYLLGTHGQQQVITLQLFDHFVDDPYLPAQWALVEVQSKTIQIYSVALKIHAKFTGLRYLLFHWPVLSALAGIASNMFFLTLLATMSWYRFVWKEPDAQLEAIGPGSMEQRRRIARALLQRERAQAEEVSSSSSMYPVQGSAVGTGPAYFIQSAWDGQEGEDSDGSNIVEAAVVEELQSQESVEGEESTAEHVRLRHPQPQLS